MILDRGVCRIYHKTSTTPKGGKPTATQVAVIHESYYGELSFETAPFRPTEKREDTRTAARVRILQNRDIRNDDVAELIPFDGTKVKPAYYRIARAFHGNDEDSGEPVSDLTLEITEKPNIQKAPAPTPTPAPEVSGNDGQ